MSILDGVIGLVAPPTCLVCHNEGQILCHGCLAKAIVPYGETCWSCGGKSLSGRTCPRCRAPGTPTYVWVATTYEGVASELLKVYKFGQLRAAANTLAAIMVDTMVDFVPKATLIAANYLVVPVPTATSRRRQRSFDHCDLLAREVAAYLGLSYLPALGRLGQVRQVGSKRSERLTQTADKYFVRLPGLVAGRRILLIDDVVTTGGTLRAATAALRQAGARRVDGLVFAKRL